MKSVKYIQQPNSAYIFMSDGTVAKKLKPTLTGKQQPQEVYNLFIEGRYTRVKAGAVRELFNMKQEGGAS